MITWVVGGVIVAIVFTFLTVQSVGWRRPLWLIIAAVSAGLAVYNFVVLQQ